MKKIIELRKYENFHIVLWLVKDLCWVTISKTMGMIMVIPTLLFAIFITWKNREDRIELMHNLAVCMWIMANSVWMYGEFYTDDSTRPLAIVFFAAGLLSISYHYLLEFLWNPIQRYRKNNHR